MASDDQEDTIAAFGSRADLERAEKLAEYIRFAREDLDSVGCDCAAPSWPGFGQFVNLQHVRQGRAPAVISAERRLDPQFIDFAKAFLLERHSCNPGEHRSNSNTRLGALRLIESALRALRGNADPLEIDAAVLNEAMRQAQAKNAERVVSESGVALQGIAAVLVEKGVSPLDLKSWRHAATGPERGYAVGAEGDDYRAARLPSEDTVRALADIFNRKLDAADPRASRDIFTTSVTAMLFGAPSRGSQIIELPVDALYPGLDQDGKEQLGLRVGASKNSQPHGKWLIEGMIPAVKKAIDRVREMTDEARRLARHLEDPVSRTKFYRHPACPDVKETDALSPEQACMALGLATSGQPHAALAKAGLSGVNGAHTLRSLWRDWVLPKHRESFPHFPYMTKHGKARGGKSELKLSDALFCMRVNQLHPISGTSPVLLWMPSLSTYTLDVCIHSRPLDKKLRRRKTIFERYAYSDESGAPFGFRSHQARHLLNTEAQRSVLPDELIARWSSRADLGQNETYDDRQTQERVEAARSTLLATMDAMNGKSAGPHAMVRTEGHWQIVAVHKSRSCSDLEDVQPQLTGLQTMYGECYHDYAASRCEGFVHCLECREHDCVKGSDGDAQAKLARIRQLKRHAAREIEKSFAADVAGDWGAAEWLKVQEAWYKKLEELESILGDPNLPDGSRIRVAGIKQPSHLDRVLRGIARNALECNSAPKDVIEQMLLAIGAKSQEAPLIASSPGALDIRVK